MFPKLVVILVAFIVATALLPGAYANMYFKSSATATCENQIGFPEAATSTSALGCSSIGGTFSVGGTAIDNVARITEDLCIEDNVMKAMDVGCTELHRAAHICIEKAGLAYLLSCNDDLVAGDFGMDLIK
jgi:hypothetical protein